VNTDADTVIQPVTDPAAVEIEDLGTEQCSEIATLARVDGGEEVEYEGFSAQMDYRSGNKNNKMKMLSLYQMQI